jgi:hypothetical protein
MPDVNAVFAHMKNFTEEVNHQCITWLNFFGDTEFLLKWCSLLFY